MIPGVQLSAPTVGGQGGATQTYMSVHGMSGAQNVVLVDGLTVSGLEFNGLIQNYFNPANSSEIVYQTSGINADRSGGGITINMIPREGGNLFAGDANFNYRPGQLDRRQLHGPPARSRRHVGQQPRVSVRLHHLARRTDHAGQAVVLRFVP